MFAIICAIGLVGCVFCIALMVRAYAKDKGIVFPFLLFALFFLVSVGSMFLAHKGTDISISSGKSDTEPSVQQNDGEPKGNETDMLIIPDEDDSVDSGKTSNEVNELQEDLKEALGEGSGLFYKEVRNDVTGRWRLFVYYSSETVIDHAVDYYNAYFESDDEIHWVVNLGLETTSSIMYSSGYLFIDVHEYVEDEEHDAKVLGGGMLLKSYSVNLSSGEIEDLSE